MKPGTKNEYPYTLARLVESGANSYVLFYIWDVQKKAKVRKRVSLRGNTPEEKKADSVDVIRLVNQRLKEGWHIDQNLPEPVETEAAPVVKPKGFTFEEACKYYKATKKIELKKNTDKLNDNYFDHVRNYLLSKGKPDIELKDITVKMMFEFFDTLKVGGRYRNNMLGFYKSFFKFYVSRELIAKNPCLTIKNVRVDASEDHRPFNADQAKEIRAAILATGDKQLWLFCQFIYFLFLRPGEELRLLKVGDILNEQVRVTSGNSKNRKTGFVDIPSTLEQLIRKYRLREYPSTDYLFTIAGHPGPQHVGENYFYKRHKKIMQHLGLFGHDYDLYSWKPTGAVVLYKATKDIMLVQRHCRHSTPDQTYTYLRKQGLVFEGQRVTEFPELWE
ncbi:phage integrase SAM-like domain-containing protein [Spirosoma sp. RP8]|uniref:Phage integrase SAM-like domain-containing protein n=1 Tax=Spirosoma liriopis TaxID=2937440 RepID=A0ABT0HL30_9BACT|nr:site-specific integrase [Spirosoma liriopis]MCK8492876.1 phage integrase SAM-like domain-containing protein [Spirosoma liriopis]